jgi:hypothetical protein
MLTRYRNANHGKPNDWVIAYQLNHTPPTAEELKRAAEIQQEIRKLQKRLSQMLGGSVPGG